MEQVSKLEYFVQLRLGAKMYGQVFVDEGILVASSTMVISGIYIGKWCVIGTGALFTKDIPDYSVAVVIPARVISSMD